MVEDSESNKIVRARQIKILGSHILFRKMKLGLIVMIFSGLLSAMYTGSYLLA
jgi:hypothetical protein